MKIGVPKEIKEKESRVALTPEAVQRLHEAGHDILVETGAGLGSGFADELYAAVGARLGSVSEAWAQDLVVKVKEPMECEYAYLQGQLLFTFLHLAGVPRSLTEALLASSTTGIAYETLEDAQGRLPLLAPMSAIAGNMAALMGAYYLASSQGGVGVQLGEVLGERHGQVLVLGDGVVGSHAAKSAHGLGARVQVAGLFAENGARLKQEIGADLEFFLSTPEAVASRVREADLVIGGVLSRGAKAEYVVTEDMIRTMRPGSVVVDVSIDQGGCIETSRPTSHGDPVFPLHGVTHYCVTNMPGAYPKTSTLALVRASLPYVLKLAESGLDACRHDPGFAKAVNTHQGFLTCAAVAEALNCQDQLKEFV